ncbi:HTH domain-containing protein [Enterococcus faecium]|nr:HTH domain-containing protein [Enterococcus faecium]EGP5496655.1 HTH domain-containing protein [Enterococcus faecium]EME3504006.1 HTH domain-containing protein [Enterococcus faecium]EME3544680.1 HTH domain-containing protein [Enterococcus faecium]
MADKTIKELAEELGVSKQAIRKYFDKLPTKLTPKLIGGKYVISAKAQEFIRNNINQTNEVDTEVDSSVDNILVKELKEKNKQIEHLQNVIETQQKLLDQQQQLTLQANQQIEKLQEQLQLTYTEESPENESTVFSEDKEPLNDTPPTSKRKWWQIWKA